jgi:hypothetical protein
LPEHELAYSDKMTSIDEPEDDPRDTFFALIYNAARHKYFLIDLGKHDEHMDASELVENKYEQFEDIDIMGVYPESDWNNIQNLRPEALET